MSLTKQDLSNIRGTILDALDVAVNPRLDSLEQKVDGLEVKVGGLEGRMNGLEGRMSGLEGRMSGLEERMTGQESQQHETNRRLNTIENQLTDMDGHLQALEADVKELYAITDARPQVDFDKKYTNLGTADKLRKLYAEVLALAKQLDVEL